MKKAVIQYRRCAEYEIIPNGDGFTSELTDKGRMQAIRQADQLIIPDGGFVSSAPNYRAAGSTLNLLLRNLDKEIREIPVFGHLQDFDTPIIIPDNALMIQPPELMNSLVRTLSQYGTDDAGVAAMANQYAKGWGPWHPLIDSGFSLAFWTKSITAFMFNFQREGTTSHFECVLPPYILEAYAIFTGREAGCDIGAIKSFDGVLSPLESMAVNIEMKPIGDYSGSITYKDHKFPIDFLHGCVEIRSLPKQTEWC